MSWDRVAVALPSGVLKTSKLRRPTKSLFILFLIINGPYIPTSGTSLEGAFFLFLLEYSGPSILSITHDKNPGKTTSSQIQIYPQNNLLSRSYSTACCCVKLDEVSRVRIVSFRRPRASQLSLEHSASVHSSPVIPPPPMARNRSRGKSLKSYYRRLQIPVYRILALWAPKHCPNPQTREPSSPLRSLQKINYSKSLASTGSAR